MFAYQLSIHTFNVSLLITIIQMKIGLISMSKASELMFELTVQAIVKRITENRENFYCLCPTST